MTSFVLHPEALADVEEIGDHIAADNPRAAAHLIGEFYERFHSLAKSPRQGHKRPNLTSRPLLFVVVRQYLVAYAPDEKPLLIVGVIHGRRNPEMIAEILRRRN